MPELTIDNSLVHYRLSSRTPPGAMAVVCLHGSGADSIVWSAQLSRLRRQYCIIAPDLPAHGRSEGSALNTAADYALWLHAFARALGLDRFFLMGHSFGGAVVQEFARMHPEQAAGLVLIGTGTRFRFSENYRELFDKGIDPDDPAACQQLHERFRDAFAFLKKNSSAALHADLMSAARFDSRAWIGSVNVPALIVRGVYDCVTPPEMPAELAAMLPHAELVTLQEAGHVVMLEARDDFNSRVSAFFESCR
jgi:pimeloyl-ACP methyl ester carboxylesterase